MKQIRCRKSYSSLQDARFEAGRAATAIANGEADILKLTSADRATYLRAMDALRPLGIPLHVAIEEYVEARQHAGAGLIAAAKEHGRRHATATVRKSIAETVKEILAAKEQDGMSVRYVQSLRSHLNRFAEHFRMNIATVTAAQIEDWLRRSKRGPRTRNNIRHSVVTLFNFARARGYLPKMVATEAEHVAKAKDRGGEIGTFTPAQLADLLNIGNERSETLFCDRSFHRLAIGGADSAGMGGRKLRTRIYPGWESESKNCDAPPGPDSAKLNAVACSLSRAHRPHFCERTCR